MKSQKRAKKIQTRGFRPRPDQIETLERIMRADPEVTKSGFIRRGMDLAIAEREGRLHITPPLSR